MPMTSCRFTWSSTLRPRTGSKRLTTPTPVYVRAILPKGSQQQSAGDAPIFTGSGIIRFTAPPNPNPEPREASLTIAGHPLTITQEGTDSVVPVIAERGVVNGATFLPGVTPNGWATIAGDFFLDAAREWGGSDFVNGKLPTSLDGVSVMIGGTPAFVEFTSRNQINVLVDDGVTGNVDVTVTTPGGGEGIVGRVFASEVLPEFFRFSPQDQRYIAAVHSDGVFVGPADLFGGTVAMRPAEPGEIVQIYGTGWGATNPPVDPGAVVAAPAPLANQVQILLAGEPAEVTFAGIVGSGLYQFNVEIPALPDSDAYLEGSILGQANRKPAFVAVQSQ
jgi:uncharacterized protein (TIGR03437 family)